MTHLISKNFIENLNNNITKQKRNSKVDYHENNMS